MRRAFALLFALVTFFGVDFGLQRLGAVAGIQSRVTYSEPVVRESYDQEYEDFGGTTTFGYAVAAFSAVIAVWVSKAVSSVSLWNQTFSAIGRRYWLAWALSTATIALIFAVSNLVFSSVRFPFKGHVWLICELAVLLVVALVAYRWAKAPQRENEA